MDFSCMDCIRRFSQIILIFVNILVSLLGLAVMSIGIWAKIEGQDYIVITDNSSQFTDVAVLVIVVGLFVLIVGGVGVVGAIFASTIFGRVILGVYAVVLTLLVICEIAGGLAAAVKKGDLENVFTESANSTFSKYNQSNETDKRDAWNSFQKTFQCCGVHNSSDYLKLLNITVPVSCCKEPDCNVTVVSNLYLDGCVDKLIKGFKNNLGVIAGATIFLGLVQIVGIVMACFVALYKKDENKYEVV